MVLCELVLDRWCFKAYKSAAAVGQLRFIVDFKLKCLPYAFHTNTSLVYPEAESTLLVDLLIPLGIFTWNLSNATRVSSVIYRVRVQYDGCGNSLHESTRTRLKS